ncbi:hypothetical protein J4Q44_G00383530, partial [Coregonus suidteri]
RLGLEGKSRQLGSGGEGKGATAGCRFGDKAKEDSTVEVLRTFLEQQQQPNWSLQKLERERERRKEKAKKVTRVLGYNRGVKGPKGGRPRSLRRLELHNKSP